MCYKNEMQDGIQNGDIVFDIETKHSFDEVGGKDQFHKLGVSVVGAYAYGDGRYAAFEEHEIPEFEKLLKSALARNGRVIGFNIHHFDIPVLQPYIAWDLRELLTLDLMHDVEQGVGFRVSLDNLCGQTLGSQKSADGMQALRWYKEGKIDLIKEYCLKDVELTKALYEFGRANGHVLFFSRDAQGRIAVPVHWSGTQRQNIRTILREALESRTSVEIEYVTKDIKDGGEPLKNRIVDIYRITNDAFEGFCHLRGAKRLFKIDRVLSAHITDNSYKMFEDVQGSLL